MIANLLPISDVPSEAPSLGFEDYASSIAHLIENAESRRFTIGIFGGYGSGKTTLMQSVKRKLSDQKFVKIDFNAWRYDNDEQLFLPFLCALCQEKRICPQPNFGARLLAAGHGLVRGLTFKFNAAFAQSDFSAAKAIEAEKQALGTKIDGIVDDYTDVYRELERLLATLKEHETFVPIVVFVDDLDRCVPEKAFALLEAIKAFADIDGFIFVLGLDPRVITAYLRKKYGEDFPITGEEYLQKMFQVPFHLPGVRDCDINNAFDAALGSVENEWGKDIRKLIQRQNMKNCFHAMPRNIRQMKRILNCHQLIMSFADDDVESDKLLAILLVSIRWPDVFSLIYIHGIDFPEIQAKCNSPNYNEERSVKALSGTEWRGYYDNLLFPLLKGTFSKVEPYLQYIGKPVH